MSDLFKATPASDFKADPYKPTTTDLFGLIPKPISGSKADPFAPPREFQPKRPPDPVPSAEMVGRMVARLGPAPDPEQIAAKLAEEAAESAREAQLDLAQEIVEALYYVDQVQCRAREVRPDSDLAKRQFSDRLRAWLRSRPLVNSRASDLSRLRAAGVML